MAFRLTEQGMLLVKGYRASGDRPGGRRATDDPVTEVDKQMALEMCHVKGGSEMQRVVTAPRGVA